MSELPVFVYGTLRPGGHNYRRFLQGATHSECAASADGFALYDFGGFPLAVPGAGSVQGCLITITSGAYRAVLADLDLLEGFDPTRPDDSLYLRRMRVVRTAQGPRVAWIYLAGPATFVPGLPLIKGGDWCAYQEMTAARSAP